MKSTWQRLAISLCEHSSMLLPKESQKDPGKQSGKPAWGTWAKEGPSGYAE